MSPSALLEYHRRPSGRKAFGPGTALCPSFPEQCVPGLTRERARVEDAQGQVTAILRSAPPRRTRATRPLRGLLAFGLWPRPLWRGGLVTPKEAPPAGRGTRAPVLLRVRNTPKTCPLPETQRSSDLLISVLSARASAHVQSHFFTFLVRRLALHLFSPTHRSIIYQ